MSIPPRLPRAQRRAQILGIAADHFAAVGYHATSMETLALAAGITKPVLYHHFASKEQLYLETVRSRGEVFVAEIVAITSEVTQEHHDLLDSIQRFTTILSQQSAAVRLLQSRELVSESVSATIEEIMEGFTRAIAVILGQVDRLTLEDGMIVGRMMAAIALTTAESMSRAASERERTHIAMLITMLVAEGISAFPPGSAAATREGARLADRLPWLPSAENAGSPSARASGLAAEAR